MPVTVYFDGSGKPDNPECKWIVLAAVSATDDLWADFQSQWDAVLTKHDCGGLHMTDAMSLKKSFAPDKGWTRERVDLLLTDLFNLIARMDRRNLHMYTAAVNLEGYRKAKEEIPTLRPVEAMCVNGTFGSLHLQDGETDQLRNIRLLFDRSEGFLHTINRVHQDARRKPGWTSQVKEITWASPKDAGLQVADFGAWTINNHYTHGPERVMWLDMMMVLGVHHLHNVWNYAEIMERYKDRPC